VDSFDTVTRQGSAIANLFGLELLISALLLALVVGWLVVALVRFRARAGDAVEPPQVHGNRLLEIIWTVTPVLTLMVVFVLMVQTMRSVEASPSDALQLRVIGHQWWWEFIYPNGQAVTANEVHVPLGTPLQVNLDSVDVIHSFHVPQFGWMRDTVPGRTNQMALFVERAGTYDGTCNQYCGVQHAWMRVRVVAEPVDQFNAWLQAQAAPATVSASRGQQVFVQNTCVNCHTIRGVSSAANVGPDLTHVGSRSTLGAGVIDNTPALMRQWLRNAARIKPGVLMPPFLNLSEADLNALAEYLESLT
jgi:cytochrome c oxidase subunit 2